MGDIKVEALKNISLSIHTANFIALCGPSGSGKTTLLNLISGIDRPMNHFINQSVNSRSRSRKFFQ